MSLTSRLFDGIRRSEAAKLLSAPFGINQVSALPYSSVFSHAWRPWSPRHLPLVTTAIKERRCRLHQRDAAVFFTFVPYRLLSHLGGLVGSHSRPQCTNLAWIQQLYDSLLLIWEYIVHRWSCHFVDFCVTMDNTYRLGLFFVSVFPPINGSIKKIFLSVK